MAHPWKDLIVWQKSHNLVIEIYKLTSDFPDNEKFGIVQQLRRTAILVPANIVEGKSKNSKKEFAKFLYISRGSLEEVRYHVLLCRDLAYIDGNQFEILEKLCSEISFLMNQIINSISK